MCHRSVCVAICHIGVVVPKPKPPIPCCTWCRGICKILFLSCPVEVFLDLIQEAFGAWLCCCHSHLIIYRNPVCGRHSHQVLSSNHSPAIVNAKGENVQPNIIPISRCCQAVGWCAMCRTEDLGSMPWPALLFLLGHGRQWTPFEVSHLVQIQWHWEDLEKTKACLSFSFWLTVPGVRWFLHVPGILKSHLFQPSVMWCWQNCFPPKRLKEAEDICFFMSFHSHG